MRHGPEFAGFVTLEGTLTFFMLTENTSDVPTAPGSAPTYAIYSVASGSATSLATGTTTLQETGVYRFSNAITAAAGFAVGGTYSILFSYTISAANRRKIVTFTVV